jgi:hypothetical protein
MDKLHVALNRRTQKSYHPAIKASMKLAAKKLDRYYSMTDLAATYRIAMGMLRVSFTSNTNVNPQFSTLASNSSISEGRNGK